MLEVRKSLFSASYTADELEKFEVNSTIAEEDKTYMAARTEISALATVSTLPDYVLVEAEEGYVVECYGLKAEHWTDLEIRSAAFGAVGSIEVGEAREEELKDDQPGMKPVSEWKLRKPKQRRKRGEYILWENGDLIGKGADAVNGYQTMLCKKLNKRPAEKTLRRIRKTRFSNVNGAHKRKGVKIELVDDLGQLTREIEGRLDWKERAAEKQRPNADSDSAAFKQYFEPRYATFPRGTRMTSERISEIKISPDLRPKEKEMLLEMLYRREAALA
ncbi:unnamed protein product [Alternaria alternata]